MSVLNAEAALAPWQRHNVRLALWSAVSIAIGIAIWFSAVTPDGRDPWYGAIAIQFVVWGAIDLAFAIGGFIGVRRIRAIDASERDAAAMKQAQAITRALRINVWLNAMWLTIGVVLLVSGYFVWSASLVGHGVGVLEQAIVLCILDASFARALGAQAFLPVKSGE